MKPHEKTGIISIITGCALILYQGLWQPIYSDITQSQALISHWEWFIIGSCLMVAGALLFERREE